MENETQVTDLVTVLEHATVMAKQLPSTTTTNSAAIYASLRAAHRHLSLFLAHTTQSPPPQQQQLQEDNIDDDDDDEPMRIADEEDSKIETMEGRLKDISIQHNNKRLKRSLSSASLDCQIESARAQFDYDPHVARLRALDLIFQFHC